MADERPGLRELLGPRAGFPQLPWPLVGDWLRTEYVANEAHKARRALARTRDDLYRGQGDEHLEELIDAAFKNKENQDVRKRLIDWSRWNNVIRRIVHEKATVYAEPARRRCTARNDEYQAFQRRVHHDAVMRELDRKLVLHEDVWIQYRVRNTPRGRAPVEDVISPAYFWAIAHPDDPTLLVGIILDQCPGDPAKLADYKAAYRVWTDAETFLLDGKCRVIETSVEVWPLGRMPGVLATTVPPSTKGCLLEHAPSADLVAAHQAVWFLNLTLLKESKSKTRQNYLTGDTSSAVLGQAADSENDAVLPDGVSVQSVDRGMDLADFRATTTQVLDDAAANHGLPPSVMHHRDAMSGAEIQLRRIPLRELRRQRIDMLRGVERELFEIQCGVNAMANPDGGIELADGPTSPDGWSIDFGEVQQPLTAQELDAVFATRRRLGLTDTVEEVMVRNPDLDAGAAEAELELHVTRETARVASMRTLQSLSGGMATGFDDPKALPPGAPSDDDDAP